jgi:hypothetical protein
MRNGLARLQIFSLLTIELIRSGRERCQFSCAKIFANDFASATATRGVVSSSAVATFPTQLCCALAIAPTPFTCDILELYRTRNHPVN